MHIGKARCPLIQSVAAQFNGTGGHNTWRGPKSREVSHLSWARNETHSLCCGACWKKCGISCITLFHGFNPCVCGMVSTNKHTHKRQKFALMNTHTADPTHIQLPHIAHIHKPLTGQLRFRPDYFLPVSRGTGRPFTSHIDSHITIIPPQP